MLTPLLAITHYVLADLVVRSTRPVVVIAFMVYFIKDFMPTNSAFVWLVLFLSAAGVWFVMGLIKAGLDKAFAAKGRPGSD